MRNVSKWYCKPKLRNSWTIKNFYCFSSHLITSSSTSYILFWIYNTTKYVHTITIQLININICQLQVFTGKLLLDLTSCLAQFNLEMGPLRLLFAPFGWLTPLSLLRGFSICNTLHIKWQTDIRIWTALML